MADSSGNITSSASYDSFGNATGNLATRYQFTGREYDNFTGLHYYRARFYDANLGRFISEDPIGFEGGDVNLYGYVGNNPLGATDSFGLDPDWDERVWRAQQDVIEALKVPIEYGIGFGDSVTLGISRLVRQAQGIDDPNLDCSTAYQAGQWTGFAIDVATGIGGIIKGVGKFAARRGARTFFKGANYSPKVLRQMGKADDAFHSFPKSVDGFATKFGKFSTKIGGDGKPYQWLEMAGSYRGKTGIFEYTKDASGIINHRFFNVP